MADPVIRIPNLPNGKIVDEEGNPSENEATFRHALISQLQKNFGDEGLVAPTQTNVLAPADLNYISQIQDHQLENGQYTCGFGRILYDATNNRILISIDGGGGVPAFMEVTLTVPIPAV